MFVVGLAAGFSKLSDTLWQYFARLKINGLAWYPGGIPTSIPLQKGNIQSVSLQVNQDFFFFSSISVTS
jgi:hypothetical protein